MTVYPDEKKLKEEVEAAKEEARKHYSKDAHFRFLICGCVGSTRSSTEDLEAELYYKIGWIFREKLKEKLDRFGEEFCKDFNELIAKKYT